MRSADLVPLLARENGGRAVGFRQGVIVAWNQATAENVVQVGTSLIENLPCLNTSEASLLTPGDVVGILTSGGSWAILGRLIMPGSPEAASSIRAITNRIQAAENIGNGTRQSSTFGDLADTAVGPRVTVRVGPSGRALAFWGAEIGQATTTATGNLLSYQSKVSPAVGVELSGANTVAANGWNAFNTYLEFPGSGFSGYATPLFWVQASTMHLFTGLTPGDTTFTLKYKSDGMAPSTFCNFSAREIAVFAL